MTPQQTAETAADSADRSTSEESGQPVIALDGVTFGYTATPVIENVSLSIGPGEYVALVGPTGSFKSTLVQLMLGLRTPDTETARFLSSCAYEFADGDRLGYVAQQASATKEMPITVREVVKLGRLPHFGFGWLSSEDWATVDNALETIGMSAFADRRITPLSGGQRQRAFIARALASEVDVLVPDEPTVGVDAESVEAFYE